MFRVSDRRSADWLASIRSVRGGEDRQHLGRQCEALRVGERWVDRPGEEPFNVSASPSDAQRFGGMRQLTEPRLYVQLLHVHIDRQAVTL